MDQDDYYGGGGDKPRRALKVLRTIAMVVVFGVAVFGFIITWVYIFGYL